MTTRPTKSIDGFVTRRPNRAATQSQAAPVVKRATGSSRASSATAQDIDIVLKAMNDETITDAPKHRKRLAGKRGRRAKRPMSRRKKIIIWVIVTILLAALITTGYFVYRALSATSKIVHGNLLSLVEPDTPLKTDDEGRTNILVFGTSQDDSAHQDAGGAGLWLTDSIMLLSLNQETHKVSMVSIPRDLWVSIPGGCSVGYQSKINAVYECGSDLVYDDGNAGKEAGYDKKDKAGAKSLGSVVETVTGFDLQYYVHVNYSVLKESVDALGGIDVEIVGDGADGIYDTNFDWKCPKGPYTCKHVYYPKNGTYTLDGEAALYLARARSDGGKYSYKNFGLNRGDYDRQANQQKILQAIQQKASSTGTLANPIKVINLLTALGNNITTDLEGGELKTLIKAAKGIAEMKSVSLVKEGESVLSSRMISGQSAQIATSGMLDYTSVKQYLAKHFAVIEVESKPANSSASGTDETADASASE